jgi:hypothetical protein
LGTTRLETSGEIQKRSSWSWLFGLLQMADFSIGFWLRGITPREQFVQLLTGQGNIYAALPTLFAVTPWAANCWPELLKLHDRDR